jgi:hypothetical protein
VWLPATPANRIGLGAEASRCGSRLARIVSHSWDSGRLIDLLWLHTPFCCSFLSIRSVGPCRLLRFAYWEAPTSGYLACCHFCLSCFLYHGASVQSVPSCRSAYCDSSSLVQFKKSTPVVVPVSTGLVPVVDRSVVQSACRCLLAYLYRACWSVRSLTVALCQFSRLLVTIVVIVGVCCWWRWVCHSCSLQCRGFSVVGSISLGCC